MTSKIEWLRSADGRPGYTINPVKGLCPVDCKDNQGKSYCYARRMYKRFKWNPEIRFDNRAFGILEHIKMPSRIFVGSTMELFGDWVGADAANYTLRQVRNFPQHTFIFLTKNPAGLILWSPFPENCHVGASACNDAMWLTAIKELKQVKATVKFISIEPFLERINPYGMDVCLKDAGINWLIIGAETKNGKLVTAHAPRIEWIREIVEVADKAGIPVFLKENLRPLLAMTPYQLCEWAWTDKTGHDLRQEFPEQ